MTGSFQSPHEGGESDRVDSTASSQAESTGGSELSEAKLSTGQVFDLTKIRFYRTRVFSGLGLKQEQRSAMKGGLSEDEVQLSEAAKRLMKDIAQNIVTMSDSETDAKTRATAKLAFKQQAANIVSKFLKLESNSVGIEEYTVADFNVNSQFAMTLLMAATHSEAYEIFSEQLVTVQQREGLNLLDTLESSVARFNTWMFSSAMILDSFSDLFLAKELSSEGELQFAGASLTQQQSMYGLWQGLSEKPVSFKKLKALDVVQFLRENFS